MYTCTTLPCIPPTNTMVHVNHISIKHGGKMPIELLGNTISELLDISFGRGMKTLLQHEIQGEIMNLD